MPAHVGGSKMPSKINFKSLMTVVKLMWKGNEVATVLMITFTLLSAVTSALGMNSTGRIIDEVLTKDNVQFFVSIGGLTESTLSDVWKIIIRWIILLSSSLIFSTIATFLAVKVSQTTIRDVRTNLFSNMQYLPVKYFDTHKYGDIMSTYTNDVDTLENFITQTLPNLVSVIASVVSVFIMMLLNNIILTLCVIVLLGFIMYISGVLLKNSTKHFISRQRLVGKLNGYIEEMMEGTRVVQVFNHQEKSVEEFKEISEAYREEELKGSVYGNIVAPVNGNLVRIEYILIAIIGALFCIYGNGFFAYSLGSLAAFLVYTNNFSTPVARFAQQLTSIAQASAGSERIMALLNEAHEEDNGYVTLVNYKLGENGEIIETDEHTHMWAWKHPHKETGDVTYTPLKGEIVLDSVDFSYNESKQILFDISVYAKPGQRIALVGETGAGKTTITNLINRFYDIEDGKIRYDGININKIKKEDLRRSLGLVLQETNLFTGTIKDNIKLGKADATDEEVIEAAKIANADSFIRMMPEGYDTILTRAGEKLSQGQRQLLAIARAAIADSPVLILDEATSSIDTRTELIVQKGMDSLMNGRTVFVIAHRLSTIQNSNAIMVMDHGRIIERGNHNDLIEAKGIYYQLYTGKFELE